MNTTLHLLLIIKAPSLLRPSSTTLFIIRSLPSLLLKKGNYNHRHFINLYIHTLILPPTSYISFFFLLIIYSGKRAVLKRVVTIPIREVEAGPRLKGNMSCISTTTPPSDSWAWRKYGQKPIKGSPYPR